MRRVSRLELRETPPASKGRGLWVIAAGIASLAICCAPQQPCPSCPPCPACKESGEASERPVDGLRWFVSRVKDGDTLVARLEGGPTERIETIRLLNVNTPEKDEPGFDEATEALKGLVRGGYVELEFQRPLVERRDGFGRLLAYVIADGVNVNIDLVRQGWSKLYTKYGKGRLHREFVAAEAEARAARRGLWSPGGRDLSASGTP